MTNSIRMAVGELIDSGVILNVPSLIKIDSVYYTCIHNDRGYGIGFE